MDWIWNCLLHIQIRLSVLWKQSHFYHYFFEEKKTEVDRGNLISLTQIFKSRWPELMNISIKSEWATACQCKCLIFRPFFSILGTLEWETDCLPHLGLSTTPTHGSFSCMCLLWSVLGWWQRDSSYKETKYFYCLKKCWYRVIFFGYQRKGLMMLKIIRGWWSYTRSMMRARYH